MSKLKINTREIGSVCIFDLVGEATEESVQEAVTKIQRNIRRHRLQRVIFNLQRMPSLEPISLRKLLSACIRPQKSLLYGVSETLAAALETTYVPRNVKVCNTEREIAEDFGPFLLDKEAIGIASPLENGNGTPQESMGAQLERRRGKRMHVALPLVFKFETAQGILEVTGIATNISEGGLFAQFLDLEATERIDALSPIENLKVQLTIFPSANFPEEYHLQARVVRKENTKKQVGLGLEFVA